MMRKLIDSIRYLIEGIPVVMAIDEDDPELWGNHRKKARIRRKWRREGRKSGKKADV